MYKKYIIVLHGVYDNIIHSTLVMLRSSVLKLQIQCTIHHFPCKTDIQMSLFSSRQSLHVTMNMSIDNTLFMQTYQSGKGTS